MSSEQERTLSVMALGGVGEIGKNMYVIQYGDDIIAIDCGSKFPDESLPGIDLIVPDISYLLENRDKVRGIIITHGHEDHIGGLPYILKQMGMPVYGTRLTLGLIEGKLKEQGLLGSTKTHVITEDSTLQLGAFTVTFFKTNHSIPDCIGVVFETPEGTVVHTGDFKFDLTPVNEESADLHRMAEIGKSGVLALLSESTNAERPGFTPSERKVGLHLEEVFRKAQQKVFIATFASNVHRLQQVVDAAFATGRKLSLIGRSMVNVVSIAAELGYMNIPDGMLIDPGEVGQYSPDKVAILCTGSQGEPMAALARLARNNHRQVEVLRGDTIIVSATPIPGNERNVSRTVDDLYRLGAHVIYGPGSSTGMHVSGHASQEELKLMLHLMRPQYFIPIHGEYRMLHQHRQLAEAVGVESENIFIVDNGDVVEFQNGRGRKAGKVPAGSTFVDGLGIGDIGHMVLRDRKSLSQDGILIVVITMSKATGTVLSGPDIVSRGFVYVRESESLMEQANGIVVRTLAKLQEENVNQWNIVKQKIKDALGKFLYDQTKRRPMILPIIVEV
ncbi:ribonuclease J [Paenibacillus mucilaginosus]|uniref:Ribonuclease J n=3 Tax=Paenibacillus mucilaginosus TaxID=61624 RepID=H6NHP2_9BACL|nr:ribonuclease J [Paenibacillus mucilaginosus]AEI41066.1 RnjA [Paenibacillus mucilaginosus KNP414]AFC29639.1 RnjA [Paenibacillus mucilaginosus 3016]AFH61815.1 ribonuclease J [Paenibacillus mucilaginosus K02]MCG7211491.1 ribonuclease J [Paenibacillus mucilaginosus]WDM30134.1 ribonuclease J [Paenibacillus mucilaginosus]